MKIKFTISDVLTSEVCWILLYQPDQETPFATLFGGHHVWNWDFCTGNLLKDGIPGRQSQPQSLCRCSRSNEQTFRQS